jgi:hypothetical protein
MMAFTREDDFVSRAASEWRNASDRELTIICEWNTILFLRLRKLVAMIFAVIFEIVIQWAVGDEPCYLIKNTLIIAILYKEWKNILPF